MSKYTLCIKLKAPLQSWGVESYHDTRETEYYPTKSAMIGIIAAALGRKREDSIMDLISLEFGIRIDAPGVKIYDYQVTNLKPYNTNASKRFYISDATYLAGVCSEDLELLKGIEYALNNPGFPIYLGRKKCPATYPITLGICKKPLYETLFEKEWLVPEWRHKEIAEQVGYKLRIIVDSTAEESSAIKRDVPVTFSKSRREYTYRYIKEMPGKPVGVPLKESNHDVFAELNGAHVDNCQEVQTEHDVFASLEE